MLVCPVTLKFAAEGRLALIEGLAVIVFPSSATRTVIVPEERVMSKPLSMIVAASESSAFCAASERFLSSESFSR